MTPAWNLLRLVSQSEINEGKMSSMDSKTSIMPERILRGTGARCQIASLKGGKKKAYYLPVFLGSQKRGRPFMILPTRADRQWKFIAVTSISHSDPSWISIVQTDAGRRKRRSLRAQMHVNDLQSSATTWSLSNTKFAERTGRTMSVLSDTHDPRARIGDF